jgi:nucleotide-binding universal stress UspA family protein
VVTKILVPLDGSKLAAKILAVVEDYVEGCQAQITLATFGRSNGTAKMTELKSAAAKAGAHHGREISQRYLEKTADDLKAKGLNVDWVFEEAAPAEAIVAFANREQVDLIAMTTHGESGFSWALGSVVEKVLSLATVPVLLLEVA